MLFKYFDNLIIKFFCKRFPVQGLSFLVRLILLEGYITDHFLSLLRDKLVGELPRRFVFAVVLSFSLNHQLHFSEVLAAKFDLSLRLRASIGGVGAAPHDSFGHHLFCFCFVLLLVQPLGESGIFGNRLLVSYDNLLSFGLKLIGRD